MSRATVALEAPGGDASVPSGRLLHDVDRLFGDLGSSSSWQTAREIIG
jgi:hypothetical protein